MRRVLLGFVIAVSIVALPTTIAFVLPSNAGKIEAAPGPGGGVPGCTGGPGSPGDIAMNGWAT